MQKLVKKNIEDIFSLTPMQEGMLFHYLKDHDDNLHIEQLSLVISGEIDIETLKKAWNVVIRTNEMLRTVFRWEKVEKPVQIVLKEHQPDIEYYDFSRQSLDTGEKKRQMEALRRSDRCRGFRLTDVPFKVTLCKLEDDWYEMIIGNHHILYDGWSNGIILEEFFKAYDKLYKRVHFTLPVKAKFREFVKWNQRLHQDRPKLEKFWRNYLDGFNAQTELSVKRKTGVGETPGRRTHQIKLEKNFRDKLEKFVKKNKITLASLLYSAWGLLLLKYNNCDDIIFGTTVSGRSAKIRGIDNMVGLFINTLPFRVRYQPNEKIRDLLFTVDKSIWMREEHEAVSLVDIKKYSQLDNKEEIFDSILVLENYPLEKRFIREHSSLRVNSFTAYGVNNYNLTTAITLFDDIEIRFVYARELFAKETIVKLSHHFSNILRKILTDVEDRISALEIISEEEKKELLNDFNKGDIVNLGDKTICGIFEERVSRAPDNTALSYGDTYLTYGVLNDRASKLACILKEKGVMSNSIAAIMSAPSPEIITGILAIIKAGGTYLPIEPEFPSHRITFMLKDSGANVLLAGKSLSGTIGFEKEVVNIEDDRIYLIVTDTGNLENKAVPNDPVYLIYTSGTTGHPKGVLLENRNLVNYVNWFTGALALTAKDKAVLTSSFAFDLGYSSIFPAILAGGELHILPKEIYLDPGSLLTYINRHDITYMKLTPSLFSTIVSCGDFSLDVDRSAALRFVVLGGEQVNLNDVEKMYRECGHIKIMNHYGPTEATIGSVARVIDFNTFADYRMFPTIGKPIDNTRVYILGKNLELLPVGVPGELWIEGEGIAAGYLNRPELTAEKFFNYRSYSLYFSEKIYKTGDLARWHWDGNIEFLGRVDDQVKVRGYRVELGEIENGLLAHQRVKEAVVIAKQDESGHTYLAAYVVPVGSHGTTDFSGTAASSELREFLLKELPEYMIPSYFVLLEELPLTPNGKVNRSLLPDAKRFDPHGYDGYTAPGNAIERMVAEIWEKVLGRDKIGINEDFFMIGGDSIKAIQIVSRLNKSELRTTIKDIFQYPSISLLGPHIKRMERAADKSVITGMVPLTPIQKEFFSHFKIDPHHYNQAVMFHSKDPLEEGAVRAVFKILQEHHDALRMNYIINGDGKVTQTIQGKDYPVSLVVKDFRNRENPSKTLEGEINRIQAGIDLEKGPLMRLGLFRLDDGDRLLIVIHHLVIDTVSWRILFEDIGRLFRQHRNSEQFSLPEKTDSLKLWSEKLSQYANSKSFFKERAYWAWFDTVEVEEPEPDFSEGENYVKDSVRLSFRLSEGETSNLLTKVNAAFGTEVNDILLTALSLSIKKAFRKNRLLVALEGHGREDIIEGADVSRTVGWFTSIFPLLLEAPGTNDLGRHIKEIKESLRRIPNKGIGYGILKYSTDERYKQDLSFKHHPHLSFNYLGQFDTDVEQMPFRVAGEPIGNSFSIKERRKYQLDIIGMIVGNRLKMNVVYNKRHYKTETMERLVDHYRCELSRVISFCSARSRREFTPGDFFYKGLTIETLDQLCRQYVIEDIYPLTPTQAGMLFHALYDSSSAYNVQVAFRIHGQLDIPLVEKSLNQLFKRHDILRTAFIYEGVDRPVQLVLKERKIDFFYRDIRGLADEVEKNEFIEGYKKNNRKRLFDLGRDVLMRVAVIRVDEAEYVFIRSNHHILMDGWGRAVLYSEFFEIYRSYILNRPWQLPPLRPYRIYIEWLEQQDREKSKTYWRHFLEDYNEAVSIPKKKAAAGDLREYKRQEYTFIVEKEKTGALSQVAAENNVTLSVIMQAVWGILLANYNNKHDVVFGVVVSGRPGEIEGVESMVGLFINTIPVRIRYRKETRFHQLIRQLQKESLESEPYQYASLADIQAESALKQHLIDHFLTFLNFPIEEFTIIETDGIINLGDELVLKISTIESLERSNYNLDVLIDFREELTIRLRYNTNIYDSNFMKKRLAAHIKEVIHQVTDDSTIRIEDIVISHDRLAANPNMPGDDGGDFDL